jgi:hypothetical protein
MFSRLFFSRRKAIFFAACFLFFFSGCFAAFAGGAKQEVSDLAKADAMIAEKKYGEAINLLTSLARRDPDQFDQVQARMSDIMARMGGFTVLANSFLDMVENNPDNLDAILKISENLLSMNAARYTGIEEFIGNIEEITRLAVNRREFDRILREGRELLDKKEYFLALLKYRSGFELYRQQMYAGYGEAAGTAVDGYIQSIDNFIEAADPVIREFKNAEAQAGALTDESLVPVYAGLTGGFDSLIKIKNLAAQALSYFEGQVKMSEEAGVKKEGRFFFPMAAAFIHGRSGQTVREGLLGVFDAMWDSAALPLERRAAEVAGALFSQAIAQVSGENFEGALSTIARITDFNRMPLDLIERSASFYRPDAAYVNVFGRSAPAGRMAALLYFTALETSVDHLSEGCLEGRRFASLRRKAETENITAAWTSGAMNAETAISGILALRRDYAAYTDALSGIITGLNGEEAVFREALARAVPRQAASESGANDAVRAVDVTRSVLEGLRGKLLDAGLEAALEYYTIANGKLEKELLSLSERFAENKPLLNGKPLTLESGEEVTAFYSREAAGVYREIDGGIDRRIEEVNRLLDGYQDEIPFIAGSVKLRAPAAETRSIADKLSALKSDNGVSLSLALERVRQSENLLESGRRLAGTARDSVKSGNFDRAYSEAAQSLAAYNDSLAMQESGALRKEIDSRVAPLIAEITRLKYEQVVRDVRVLVNKARDSYFDGNFEQAEQTLLRAGTRWSTVSAEPEAETTYWLTLVRGALLIRGGRTIEPTAPLYPEMSQLLSGAHRNYEEGMRLLNGSRREEGLRMFEAAARMAQEVRLLFPVNQDAGILELRIDQVTDPAAFNQNFSRRFQMAVEGTRRGSIEAYADLQNLAHINPRYPGMKAAVSQAEIDMGIRPAPPDPRKISRSNELAAAAQRMLNANIRSQFTIVLDNVNEALSLNPNNTLAMRIKDRVQVAIGGAMEADSYTEQEYMRAVSELQNGNNLLALSIVRRLLQRPENRDSVRLNELLRRIEANM